MSAHRPGFYDRKPDQNRALFFSRPIFDRESRHFNGPVSGRACLDAGGRLARAAYRTFALLHDHLHAHIRRWRQAHLRRHALSSLGPQIARLANHAQKD